VVDEKLAGPSACWNTDGNVERRHPNKEGKQHRKRHPSGSRALCGWVDRGGGASTILPLGNAPTLSTEGSSSTPSGRVAKGRRSARHESWPSGAEPGMPDGAETEGPTKTTAPAATEVLWRKTSIVSTKGMLAGRGQGAPAGLRVGDQKIADRAERKEDVVHPARQGGAGETPGWTAPGYSPADAQGPAGDTLAPSRARC